MTSAPGTSEAGFTLVELVVAITIIGIAAAAIVLTLPGAGDDARRSALRLAAHASAARDAAILSGRPVLFTHGPGGWQAGTQPPVRLRRQVRRPATSAPPPPCGHLPQGGRCERGFSLIEVMVALAIFGLAAVALIRLQGVSLASATTLSDRGQAAIVARNQALEAWLSATPPGPAQGRERAGWQDWAWTRQTSPGPDPGTIRIAVTVRAGNGQTIASDQLLWSRR